MKHTLIIALLIFLSSCGAKPPVRYVPVNSETTVRERPAMVVIPADSANLRALLECDSLNRVVLRALDEIKTPGLESNFSLEEGKIIYRLRTIRDTITVYVTDTVFREQVPVEVPVPYEVNRLKWYQLLLICVGVFSIVLFLIKVIYKSLTKVL
ncbi:MAG: hypothetical protein KGZ82_10620 [Bacteroidales bacterium]|nr:hypothetical protein [Bacteroidales bacterium]